MRIAFCLGLALLLAAWGVAGAAEDAPEPAKVRISGEWIDVNGHTEVPVGLFGFHHNAMSPERTADWGVTCYRVIHASPNVRRPTDPDGHKKFDGLDLVIDCIADRYHPATVLTNPDYEKFFTETGAAFAEAAKKIDGPVFAEFWNEPFLNWAVKPGVNYDPKFYVLDEAEVGKPMRIKGWKKPLEHLVWDKAVRTVHARDGRTDIQAYLAHAYIGRHKKAGEAFTFRGRKFRNVETWWGRDPTQKSWYSGKQNGQFYDWMFVPWARAVKKANPDVTVIGGWNFNISLDNWNLWRTLLKPTIDAGIEYMDATNEHHYGVGAPKVTGWYEVVCAYAVGAHDKWLYTANTECGGSIDSQLPGNEQVAGKDDPLRKAAGEFTWHVRDLVNVIHKCPDKAISRTKHGHSNTKMDISGDEAYMKLLKPIRGRLIHTESDDRGVWPIAAMQGGRLAVIVFNDHPRLRRVDVAIDAPEEMRFADGERMHVELDARGKTFRLVRSKEAASGKRFTASLKLAGRTAVRFVFPVSGKPAGKPQVLRRQYFARGVLHPVAPKEPVALEIDVDAKQLAAARSAHLRLVLEGVRGRGERVEVNGRAVKLPATGSTEILDAPVPVERLRRSNTLEFSAGEKPWRLDMASIVLDAEAKPSR